MWSVTTWFDLLLVWFGWFANLCLVGSERSNNLHRNVSDLLDNLLRGYDNSIRPDFGGAPLEVEIDIMVRSMGLISELDMTYSMDMYFRQSWIDRRLSYSSHNATTLALSISMLEKIWKPDTYFYNGRHSYLHIITTPNQFVRLFQEGRVLYSSRLTVKASCPMHLENFPMDRQRCPLKLGSFGYTTRDVLYRWKIDSTKPIDIAADMKMSQFDLISTLSGNATDILKSGEFSNLVVSFYLQRHMGNFLIQVYGPCTLLVVLSWVSFWINREATADRVSLGVTTVLTMTFLGLDARTDLPKVPYPTALDFFVFLSYAFIFATIIQFAIVHHFTKKGSGELYFNDGSSSSSSEDEGDEESEKEDNDGGSRMISRSSGSSDSSGRIRISGSHAISHVGTSQVHRPEMSIIHLPILPPQPMPSTMTLPKCLDTNRSQLEGAGFVVLDSLSVSPRYPQQPPQIRPTSSQSHLQRRESTWSFCTNAGRKRGDTLRKRRRLQLENVNSVSKLDIFARIFFPLLFLILNVFYWYYYLYKSNDDDL